jgi:hypothetical protein
VALVTVALFGVPLLVITAFELVTGRSVSSMTGGSGSGDTTISQVSGHGSGGRDQQKPEESPTASVNPRDTPQPSDEPTVSPSPSLDVEPTPTDSASPTESTTPTPAETIVP